MDKNLIWQYIGVSLLILAALIRMIVSLRKKSRKKGRSCCGCSLSDACEERKKISKSDSCNEC